MTPLFSLAIFLGAGLLFLIQPMVGKLVLPRLGGSPATWNTCMVFFQAALLIGYAYAHGVQRWRSRVGQVALHAVVLGLPLLVLPIAVPAGWRPPAEGEPAWALLGLLAMVALLPVAVLATTGPLMQAWYSRSGAARSADPYFLYAASNAGSFLGLLAYPFVLEPSLGLAQQGRVWTIGYGAYAILALTCGVAMARSGVAAAHPSEATAPELRTDVSWRDRLWWLACSMAPSCLLLGATQYIATDVGSAPLLWVLPLGLYLLTFVLAFGRIGARLARPATWLFLPLGIAVGLSASIQIAFSVPALLGLHLSALLAGCLAAHTALAARRPGSDRLTEFYLIVALGGVLGGALNALVAPLVFSRVWEYPIALAAVVFVAAWPATVAERPIRRWGLAALVGAAGAWGLVGRGGEGVELHRERTFFGVHVVEEVHGIRVGQGPNDVLDLNYRLLKHGTTRHGAQVTAPDLARFPSAYYHPTGPIGSVMRIGQDEAYFEGVRNALVAAGEPAPSRPDLTRVALVGMGVGAMAAYSRAGDEYTFFEIDPAVVRIASDPTLFTYLSQAKGRIETVLGDGRLTMAQQPDGRFGLIVLDAFSSDAIPAHLLTAEAFEMYGRKLAPGGIIAVHISNRHLDLRPVMASVAEAQGYFAIVWPDNLISPAAIRQMKTQSIWVAMARRVEDLRALDQPGTWTPLEPPPAGFRLWTDDYSNMLDVLFR